MRAGGLIAALAAAFLLAACASGGARPSQAILRLPPVDYGPPGDIRNPPQGPFQPNAYLRACPGMRVSNAPPIDAERWVIDYKPIIVAFGIVLATSPANDVCLSSGHGLRDGRGHDGIDLTSRPPGPVYSAAPGRIVEARFASGYGLTVVIDHGHGVFTRYAHLDSLAHGISPGQTVGFGYHLGQMGATGNATAPHLHYEILTGNLNNPRGTYGLTSHNPFNFPAYVPMAEAGY
ncbi:MAG: M23 family metallopeptidase [Hyphomonas sp.]